MIERKNKKMLNLTLKEVIDKEGKIYFGEYTEAICQIWFKKQNYCFEAIQKLEENLMIITFKTEYSWYMENDLEKFMKLFGAPINGKEAIGCGMYTFNFKVNLDSTLGMLVKKFEQLRDSL